MRVWLRAAGGAQPQWPWIAYTRAIHFKESGDGTTHGAFLHEEDHQQFTPQASQIINNAVDLTAAPSPRHRGVDLASSRGNSLQVIHDQRRPEGERHRGARGVDGRRAARAAQPRRPAQGPLPRRPPRAGRPWTCACPSRRLAPAGPGLLATPTGLSPDHRSQSTLIRNTTRFTSVHLCVVSMLQLGMAFFSVLQTRRATIANALLSLQRRRMTCSGHRWPACPIFCSQLVGLSWPQSQTMQPDEGMRRESAIQRGTAILSRSTDVVQRCNEEKRQVPQGVEMWKWSAAASRPVCLLLLDLK